MWGERGGGESADGGVGGLSVCVLAEESEGECEWGAVGGTVSGGWEVSVGERERGACGNG